MSRPLFAAEGVGRRFGSRLVLKNGSCWVQPGRITSIFGRNGSGKTTLLRCATGLTRMDHGVVHYDGASHLRPSLAALARRGLMFVPAEGVLMRGRRVVPQIDAFAWRFRAGRTTQQALDALRLDHVGDAITDELSGGEQRRASIAAVIARAPRCLLIDEPLAGVAPKDRELISTTLRQIAAAGCGILLTGHDVESVLEISDDVIWMTAGTTHGIGTPADAVAHEQFRREYLGPKFEPLRQPTHP
ncbi:MAG TPA: ATP-binding cassette domain-containing protein [Longimicrobiales bacterium]